MAVGIGVTEAKGVKSGHNIFIVSKQTEYKNSTFLRCLLSFFFFLPQILMGGDVSQAGNAGIRLTGGATSGVTPSCFSNFTSSWAASIPGRWGLNSVPAICNGKGALECRVSKSTLEL